jgi:hypothetical protein
MYGLLVYDFGVNWTLWVHQSKDVLEHRKNDLTWDRRLSCHRKSVWIETLDDLVKFKLDLNDGLSLHIQTLK